MSRVIPNMSRFNIDNIFLSWNNIFSYQYFCNNFYLCVIYHNV